MPRYFFTRTNGCVEHDPDGVELEDDQAARLQAVLYAAASLKDDPSQVSGGQDYRIELLNEAGALFFTVVIQTIETPAIGNDARAVM